MSAGQAVESLATHSSLLVLARFIIPKLSPRLGRLAPARVWDLANRVASTYHAVVMVQASARFLATHTRLMWDDPFHGQSAMVRRYVSWSFGYFVFDTAFLLIMRAVYGSGAVAGTGTDMLAHHAVGLVAPVIALGFGLVNWFLMARGVVEASTPFLNAAMFLKHLIPPEQHDSSRLLSAVQAVFAVLFVATRCLPVPFYWYIGARSYSTFRAHWVVRWGFFAMGFGLDVLNAYWARTIVRKARRKLRVSKWL